MGQNRVGRVIARPFTGPAGNFVRTPRRHDYAVDPPKPMLLDVLKERRVPVFGIGKIHDIYNGRGVDDYVTTKSNADGIEKLTAAVRERKRGLIFCNLVDFDMLYGHRKDVEGFASSLEEFDAAAHRLSSATRPARSAHHHRRPRVRSRSALGDHRSFARVRPDLGLFARPKIAASTSVFATRSPTWGKLSPKISALQFPTERASSPNSTKLHCNAHALIPRSAFATYKQSTKNKKRRPDSSERPPTSKLYYLPDAVFAPPGA